VTTRQHKVHTQLGRAAVQIFAANDRMNQVLIERRSLRLDAGRTARRWRGHVQKFRRDGWGRPWPVGVEMLCYMLSHEAHHRGQVCMLAHQLGFPLPIEVGSGIWNWEICGKSAGRPAAPGNDS
jgi:uncharacterized damage-inducible protein DinB